MLVVWGFSSAFRRRKEDGEGSFGVFRRMMGVVLPGRCFSARGGVASGFLLVGDDGKRVRTKKLEVIWSGIIPARWRVQERGHEGGCDDFFDERGDMPVGKGADVDDVVQNFTSYQ